MVGDHPSADPSPVPTDAPTMGAGRYAFAAKLALGGMAAVYRVWDHKLRVWRAIKVLLPDAKDHVRARFETEAKMMARLDHPHVIRVYDVGTSGQLPYIVMELAEGGTVNGWVEEHGPMPPQLAVKVVMQVALGLSAAHAQGLVHRDVKPHNVLVTSDGRCKVTDFGIARVLESAEEGQTRTGTSMGTLGYMAPEQRNDARSVDLRADVYSLGALLYKLVVGKVLTDLFLVEHEPQLLDEVPQPLQEVIVRACYRDRQRRYPSAEAMRRVLAEILPLLPPDPPDTPPLSRPPTPEPDPGYEEISALLDDLRAAARAANPPAPYTMSRPPPVARSGASGGASRAGIGMSPSSSSRSDWGRSRTSRSDYSRPDYSRTSRSDLYVSQAPVPQRDARQSLPPASLPPGPVSHAPSSFVITDMELEGTKPELQAVPVRTMSLPWIQGLALAAASWWGIAFALVFMGVIEVHQRANETEAARERLLLVVRQEQGLVPELVRHGTSAQMAHQLGELYQVAVEADGSFARLHTAIVYSTAVEAEARRVLVNVQSSDLAVMRARNVSRAWTAYATARARWATTITWPHGRIATWLRLAPVPIQ
jgi:serine/threonine protein kinase